MSWFMVGGAAIGAGAGAIIGNNSSSIDQGQAIMGGAMLGGMGGMAVGGLAAPAATGSTGAVQGGTGAVGSGLAKGQVAAGFVQGGPAAASPGFMSTLANNPMMTASMLGGAMNIAGAFTSSAGSAPSTNVPLSKEHKAMLGDLKESEKQDRTLVKQGGYNNLASARIGQFARQLQESEKVAEKAQAVAGTQASVEGSSMSGKNVMAGVLRTTEKAGGAQRIQGLRNESAREAWQKHNALSGNIANIESQTPYLKAQADVAGDRAAIMDQQRRGGAIAGGLDMMGMASYYNTRNRA